MLRTTAQRRAQEQGTGAQRSVTCDRCPPKGFAILLLAALKSVTLQCAPCSDLKPRRNFTNTEIRRHRYISVMYKFLSE